MDSKVEADDSIIAPMPPGLANKIAAGEVIQRPGSVVKELLDNAIDAGADKIRIIIQNAGRTLVQVIDNGCGMASSDLRPCFQLHATSKIHEIDDLFRIRTLGFRGEAMASIASVAQVEVKSKRQQDSTGTLIEIEGGEEKRFEPVASDDGTSVAVRNLFYNIPARRQFLKTDATEFRHILKTVQSVALATTDISIELIADGNTVYKLPPGKLEQRIVEIFGKQYRGNLIPFEENTSFVRIHGVLSDPKISRKSRGQQFLYVNNRPVQHRVLSYQLHSVYKAWTDEDEYPFFTLFLDIDPTHVDVNVHPAKLEVKFDDERSLVQLTRSVVKKALNEYMMVPGIAPGASIREDIFDTNITGFGNNDTREVKSDRENVRYPSRINFKRSGLDGTSLGKQLYGDEPIEEVGRQGEPAARNVSFWQLHDRYILTQTRTGLCMIDQHLAHMRIIFEKTLSATEESLPSTQQLLFAQNLELTAADFSLLEELMPIIKRMGFSVQLLSGTTVVISGVPADITIGDESQVLTEMLQQYRELDDSIRLDARKKVAISFASRVAIPSGKKLQPVEMEMLIDQLFACEMPYQDPLNRPTLFYMSVDEIKGKFR